MKSEKSPYRRMIFVCMNATHDGETRPVCASACTESLLKSLKEEVKKRGLKGKIRALKSGCMDLCEKGPNVMVYPEGTLYSGVTAEDIPELLQTTLSVEAK